MKYSIALSLVPRVGSKNMRRLLAAFGSAEAVMNAGAERLTEAGVLVPCWRCGGEAELQEIHTGGKPVYAVSCKKHHCGAYGCAHQTKKNAVAYWNTRAPILSSSEMEMLEGLE